VRCMLVGTGMQIPAAAASVLNQSHGPPATTAAATPTPSSTQQSMPPIATQCFMLSNMFDAKTRSVAVSGIFVLFFDYYQASNVTMFECHVCNLH